MSGEFRGHLRLGFEVASFVPCGHTASPDYGDGYWFEGRNDVYEQYAALVDPLEFDPWSKYPPVYVRVRGRVSPPGEYGHLGLYDRRIVAYAVLEMSLEGQCSGPAPTVEDIDLLDGLDAVLAQCPLSLRGAAEALGVTPGGALPAAGIDDLESGNHRITIELSADAGLTVGDLSARYTEDPDGIIVQFPRPDRRAVAFGGDHPNVLIAWASTAASEAADDTVYELQVFDTFAGTCQDDDEPPPCEPRADELLPIPAERITATASSTLPPADEFTYDVANTIDGDPSTAWNHDGAEHPPVDVTLRYAFDRPHDVAAIDIINGYAKTDHLFQANHRVRDLTVTTDDETYDFRLDDTAAPQRLETAFSATETVELRIDSVYEGTGFPDVAITSVQFLTQVALLQPPSC